VYVLESKVEKGFEIGLLESCFLWWVVSCQ